MKGHFDLIFVVNGTDRLVEPIRSCDFINVMTVTMVYTLTVSVWIFRLGHICGSGHAQEPVSLR